jgi:predicted MPP superfamily phosphohydrolase
VFRAGESVTLGAMSTAVPFAGHRRWLRLWLLALNLCLLLATLGLGFALRRRALWLAAVVPIAIVPFSYARLRLDALLARALAGRPRTFAAVAATGIALDVILAAQLLTGRASHGVPILYGPGINWAGPVWFSAHALLFLGFSALGAARVLRRLVRRPAMALWRRLAPPADGLPGGLASPARRELLQRAGLVGAGVPFFVSLSSVPLSYDLRVEKRELELPGWPRELDGLRVVHLSDIHVGGGMTRDRLLAMAELANEAEPDLVAHTGDFLTHRNGDFDAPLYEALARIRAPYGQWACLGNHDFDDPERFVRKLTAAGVVVLRDRTARIEVRGQPLEIAGADFLFARTRREETYARLMESFPPRVGTPRLLLNHDPRAFLELPDGCADLVLSGHTHGGHVGVQIGRDHAITLVGMVGIPDQGVFERGDMRMFVTRCVGFYGYPMRVGIPPEIALLVLRSPGSRTTPA